MKPLHGDPDSFDQRVFINCPFDDEYRPLLMVALFTVQYISSFPMLAFDNC